MKRTIVLCASLFISTVLLAQNNDVCEDEAKEVIEELNDINFNKCIVEKASTGNKDKEIIKSRITNRLNLNVSSRARKKPIRYSNKRKRKLNSVIKAIELSRGIDKNTSNTVLFSLVEELPKFMSCKDNNLGCFNQEFKNHFNEYFSYPDEAITNKLEGRVFVKFIIDKNGNINNINTYSSGNKKVLEDEVKRILSNFPKLEAGKEKGKQVNVVYSIPIDFKL